MDIEAKIIKKKEMLNNEYIYFNCKVVSRNMITDFVQGIRNMLGLELKAYTNTIKSTVEELKSEMPSNLKWFRIDIEQLSKGALMVSIYGEKNV